MDYHDAFAGLEYEISAGAHSNFDRYLQTCGIPETVRELGVKESLSAWRIVRGGYLTVGYLLRDNPEIAAGV